MIARDQLDRYPHVAAEDHGPELAKLCAKAQKASLAPAGASPRDGPTRIPEGPPTDRAAVPHEPLARCNADARAWSQPHRRVAVRGRDVACRGAGDRLARPARRREHAAGRPRSAPALTPDRKERRQARAAGTDRPAAATSVRSRPAARARSRAPAVHGRTRRRRTGHTRRRRTGRSRRRIRRGGHGAAWITRWQSHDPVKAAP